MQKPIGTSSVSTIVQICYQSFSHWQLLVLPVLSRKRANVFSQQIETIVATKYNILTKKKYSFQVKTEGDVEAKKEDVEKTDVEKAEQETKDEAVEGNFQNFPYSKLIMTS